MKKALLHARAKFIFVVLAIFFFVHIVIAGMTVEDNVTKNTMKKKKANTLVCVLVHTFIE